METKKITEKKQTTKKTDGKTSFAKLVLTCMILAYILAGFSAFLTGFNIATGLTSVPDILFAIAGYIYYLADAVALALSIIGIVIGAQVIKRVGDVKGFSGTKVRTIYLTLCIILLVFPTASLSTGGTDINLFTIISTAIGLGLSLAIAIISTKHKQALLA